MARVLGVPPDTVRAPSGKREAHARRVAAFVLHTDCRDDARVGETLGAAPAVVCGWRSLVQRQLRHDRTLRHEIAQVARALRTWAA